MSGLDRALEAISKTSDDLFAFEIDDIEIVFRLPSIKTAKQYSVLLHLCENICDRSTIYESIFRHVICDDWLRDKSADLPAGIPETVAKMVLRLSGLDNEYRAYTEELLRTGRKNANSNILYIKRVICSAFLGYTFESLDSLNYQSLIEIFVQAEKLLIDKGIIEQEHDFSEPKASKKAPFQVEELIKKDQASYNDYASTEREDPRKLAYMQKLREGAMKRAQEEEKKYKKNLLQQK